MTEASEIMIKIATISRTAAASLVNAAMDASAHQSLDIAVAVTDAAGHLVSFQRSDGARFLAIDVAIDKAWTAASSGIATHVWNAVLGAEPAVAPLSHHPRLLGVGGGYPIIVNGQIIGGIGISGGSHVQDQSIAAEALAIAGFTA